MQFRAKILRFGWQELAAELGLEGDLDQFCTVSRYVDDVFIATRWFRMGCCEKLLKRIYKSHITFDKSCDGLDIFADVISLRFPDLWVYQSWSSLIFTLDRKNVLYAFSGLPSLFSKFRFPSPWSSRSCHVRRISSDFKMVIARLNQFGVSRDGAFIHLLLHVSELLRSGYSLSECHAGWRQYQWPQASRGTTLAGLAETV